MPAPTTFGTMDDNWEVSSPPEAHEAVLQAIQKAGIATVSAEIAMVPKNLVKLEGKNAQGMMRLERGARRA